MERNPQVLVQIAKIDSLLATSGVRDFCMSCIRGPKGGCCQHCSHLGPNGCTAKPLSCALWLCNKAMMHFPATQLKLVQIAKAATKKWSPQVVYGFRHFSVEAEQCGLRLDA